MWQRYDSSVDESFLVYRQQLHVSILSVGSFTGRLLSGELDFALVYCQSCFIVQYVQLITAPLGVGSDFLVKVLKASRGWCLVIASFVFFIAQVCALNVENPHFLGFVSGLSGLGYGFLFGVFPSIVAETFGIRGLSQNWGFMTLSPVISGNVFNLFYGTVFDSHKAEGKQCYDGLECYKDAYFVTLGACVLGFFVTLWSIHRQHQQRLQEAGKGAAED